MPTYRFYNKNTKTEFEEYMSIAEMEKFKKKKHIDLLPPTQLNIVSTTGTIDGKTDDGWKETLAKISEAHPSSELNKQYGKTSITDIKVNQVREKHKTLAKRRMAKQNPIK